MVTLGLDTKTSSQCLARLVVVVKVGIFCLPLLVEVLLLDSGGEDGQEGAGDHSPRPNQGPHHEFGVPALGDTGVAPRLVSQPGVLEPPGGQPPLDLLELRSVVADGTVFGLPVRDIQSSSAHRDDDVRIPTIPEETFAKSD